MWTPVRTEDGSWTLRHPLHGEACHSLSGAWRQARERYAGPCRLRELCSGRERVRLLDVGTGLGLNLAAALEAASGGRAVLQVTTLERDEEVLAAALALDDWPTEVELWHRHVRALLVGAREDGRTSANVGGVRIELQLALGDAQRTIESVGSGFDAVFLDPFSPRVESGLWQERFLSEIARRMTPDAILSTYSASLTVRAALSRVGLRIGRGPSVGTKSAGTLASRSLDLPPLDPRTARKLQRRSEREPGSLGAR